MVKFRRIRTLNTWDRSVSGLCAFGDVFYCLERVQSQQILMITGLFVEEMGLTDDLGR